MKVHYIFVGFALFLFNNAHADDHLDYNQQNPAEEFVRQFDELDYLECYSHLEHLKEEILNRESNGEIKYEALRLVAESIRLRCERNRLTLERKRLSIARDRLLKKANELDQKWSRAHNSNPQKFKDYPGRDRSQRKMRHDAGVIYEDTKKIAHDIEGLEFSSVRVLRLAMDVDAGVQADFLRRLLGSLAINATVIG